MFALQREMLMENVRTREVDCVVISMEEDTQHAHRQRHEDITEDQRQSEQIPREKTAH